VEALLKRIRPEEAPLLSAEGRAVIAAFIAAPDVHPNPTAGA
jgi:hypothetical protein